MFCRAWLKHSRVPLGDVRAHPDGAVFDAEFFVQPARDGHNAKLEVAPNDVLTEIQLVAESLGTVPALQERQLLLTVRRLREFANSVMSDTTTSRDPFPEVSAFVHPLELERLGLVEGERVSLSFATGSMEAVLRADSTLRRGMVAVTHCWSSGATMIARCLMPHRVWCRQKMICSTSMVCQ